MSPPSRRFRTAAVLAGIVGLTGVALGALGAHAMAAKLAERGMAHAWETAARYHLVHALALLGAAAWLRSLREEAVSARRLSWAVHAWTVGTILFSGSLYWLASGGPRWLGPVTPFGGVALMLGWALVIAAALTRQD